MEGCELVYADICILSWPGSMVDAKATASSLNQSDTMKMSEQHESMMMVRSHLTAHASSDLGSEAISEFESEGQ